MSLTRREILEQLSRLGIRTIDGLKRSCREYEAYWSGISGRSRSQACILEEESIIQES